MTGRVRVGAAAWKKPTWRGTFYPAGLAQRRELAFASSQLSTLEINATFHGDQKPATFASWRDETPDGFSFAVKASKFVVRTYRAPNPRERIDRFFSTGVYELGEKLGPVLWQFPSGVPFGGGQLARFADALPSNVRHCFEARDPSFDNPDFRSIAAEHAIAIAVTNDPAQPSFDETTADFSYMRLSADAERHADGYDDPTLDTWAARVSERQQSGDVYVYFTHKDDTGAHTPFDAIRLQSRLSEPPDSAVS